MLCFLLSLACSSAKIVWPGMAPVTVTAENYNAVTERFTIITKDDCHIAPKNTYTSIAVGGDLYDASCGTNTAIGTKNSWTGGMQPHYVASLKSQVEGCVGVQAAQNCPSGGGNVPYCNACQNCQNGGRSNINLQGARELREQPFDWESIEDMVCAMPEGTHYDGGFKVLVVDQGSNPAYDAWGKGGKIRVDDSMRKTNSQYNTATRGCIVVYKGASTLLLSAAQNSKWVCSVLAPFATAVYNGDTSQYGGPGYIDGNIVARSFTASNNRQGSSGQLHGYPYQGTFPGPAPGRLSCSGKPNYGLSVSSPPPSPPPPSPPPPSPPLTPSSPPSSPPFEWGAQHCITEPITGKKACVVMPYGHDINSNDPTVKRAMTLAFRTEPLGNTVYVPPPDQG